MVQELWLAIRQLRRNPGYTVASMLTVALGIGLTTGVFSVIKGVTLDPLPYLHPDRLVWIHQLDKPSGADGLVRGGVDEPFSYPDFFDIRNASIRSLSGLASYHDAAFTMTGNGPAERLEGEVVSGDFFSVLGVKPLRGRVFERRDEAPGSSVAIVSEQFWRERLAAAPDAVGKTIRLGARIYTVVGIVATSVIFPMRTPPPSIWTTLAIDAGGEHGNPLIVQRGMDVLEAIGRLKPDGTIQLAQAEIDTEIHRLAKQFPATNSMHNGVIVKRESDHLVGDAGIVLRLNFAAAMLLLSIACVNAAGLSLARAANRGGEMAIRLSLGAGGYEIIRQVLIESLVVSVAGGVIGVEVALISLRTFALLAPPQEFPRLQQVAIDGGVLLFAAGISVLTGVLFGILPAVGLSTSDPANALRQAGRTLVGRRGANGFRSGLVITETALGVIILIAASVLAHSLIHILQIQPGFDVSNVQTASLGIPTNYPNSRRTGIYKELFPTLVRLPGVKSVAAGWPLPLSDNNALIRFTIEGRRALPGQDLSEAINIITPGYFQTIGIPLLQGRDFSGFDNHSSEPVMVVNEKFAQKYFPGQPAIGKRVRVDLGDGEMNGPMREIVGVVANAKRRSLTADMDPQYYLPYEQCVVIAPDIVARTLPNIRLNLAGQIHRCLTQIDSSIPVYGLSSMGALRMTSASRSRFQVFVVGSFSLVAVVLTALGLYSTLSYSVAQRTSELGIRLALGASPANVLALVVRQGILLTGAGLLAGTGLSLAMTHMLDNFTYRIGVFDPASICISLFLVSSMAALASSIPAMRAARLDPLSILRQQ